MSIIPFTKPPVRAIKVIPYSANGLYCWARYEGDEWTNELRFDPPMKVPVLLRLLRECEQARGLPIVFVHGQPSRVSA